ncbi:MAG: GNAT family N-acetyltransferase [Chloroflexi bacterium]|nr:GNAT family N-acetyltransferase [Chloroflexota bacterium]
MILGERIRLRALDKDDLPRFVQWLNDPEVRHGLAMYLPFSQTEEEQWFENMLKSPQEQHPLMIEIQAGEDWVPVGNVGLFGIDWRIRSAEVGIAIGEKKYWNQGYGTDALKLFLQHGFSTLNLNRIMLRVYETNPRAIRSYEKAGFVHEGRQRQAHFHNGEYVDVLLLSVLRSEWGDALPCVTTNQPGS